jgi:hypothetical protein
MHAVLLLQPRLGDSLFEPDAADTDKPVNVLVERDLALQKNIMLQVRTLNAYLKHRDCPTAALRRSSTGLYSHVLPLTELSLRSPSTT